MKRTASLLSLVLLTPAASLADQWYPSVEACRAYDARPWTCYALPSVHYAPPAHYAPPSEYYHYIQPYYIQPHFPCYSYSSRNIAVSNC